MIWRVTFERLAGPVAAGIAFASGAWTLQNDEPGSILTIAKFLRGQNRR
jgi:hypothetical protein